jgi:hypothetical protein
MWNSLEARYRGVLALEADAKGLAGYTQWLRKLPVAELVERGHLEPNLGTATEWPRSAASFTWPAPSNGSGCG